MRLLYELFGRMLVGAIMAVVALRLEHDIYTRWRRQRFSPSQHPLAISGSSGGRSLGLRPMSERAFSCEWVRVKGSAALRFCIHASEILKIRAVIDCQSRFWRKTPICRKKISSKARRSRAFFKRCCDLGKWISSSAVFRATNFAE